SPTHVDPNRDPPGTAHHRAGARHVGDIDVQGHPVLVRHHRPRDDPGGGELRVAHLHLRRGLHPRRTDLPGRELPHLHPRPETGEPSCPLLTHPSSASRTSSSVSVTTPCSTTSTSRSPRVSVSPSSGPV